MADPWRHPRRSLSGVPSYDAYSWTFKNNYFSVFSHLVLGHPRLPIPLIPENITSLSPHSCLTTCPTYIKAACVTIDAIVDSDLMYSNTHALPFLSNQSTIITLLQHHIANALTFFLSGFLIVCLIQLGCDNRTKCFHLRIFTLNLKSEF